MCVPSHHDGLFLFTNLAGRLWTALPTRCYFGVTSTAAAAVAALVLPLSRKGEGIGYFALSTNLAMVVGPLVGLLLMQYWGPSAVFFFLILGALFTLIAMICNALPSSVTRPSASFRSFQ